MVIKYCEDGERIVTSIKGVKANLKTDQTDRPDPDRSVKLRTEKKTETE